MAVFKRGDKWVAKWRDREGRQKQRAFDRKKDAEAHDAEMRVGLRTGTYVDPAKARETLGAQRETWLKHRRASEGRLSLERSMWAKHLAPRWADVRLEDIDYPAVNAWVGELAGTMSASYLRGCHQLLCAMLDDAVRARRLHANPARLVKVPTEHRPPLTPDDVLDAAEVRRTAQSVPATHARWSAFVFASAWLGWRLGEGLAIRRCDINLLRGEITIGRFVIEEVPGRIKEGFDTRPHVRRGGKNKASTGRVVPLPPSVAKALEQHMAEYVDDVHEEAFIFTLANGCHPSRSNLLRQVLTPALARAGVTNSAKVRKDGDVWLVHWYDAEGLRQREVFEDEASAVAFHARTVSRREVDWRQLRHTAASLMLASGVDVVDVSRRLGHARTSMTLDVYTHLMPRTQAEGTAKIEAAIGMAQ